MLQVSCYTECLYKLEDSNWTILPWRKNCSKVPFFRAVAAPWYAGWIFYLHTLSRVTLSWAQTASLSPVTLCPTTLNSLRLFRDNTCNEGLCKLICLVLKEFSKTFSQIYYFSFILVSWFLSRGIKFDFHSNEFWMEISIQVDFFHSKFSINKSNCSSYHTRHK